MGISQFLDHTAITIDPLLLKECNQIWQISLRVNPAALPPSPYEVAMMDVARLQVVTWAEIEQFYADEDERKQRGLS